MNQNPEQISNSKNEEIKILSDFQDSSDLLSKDHFLNIRQSIKINKGKEFAKIKAIKSAGLVMISTYRQYTERQLK